MKQMKALLTALLLAALASAQQQTITIVGPGPGEPTLVIEIIAPGPVGPVEPEPPVEPIPPLPVRTTYYVAPDGDNGRSCAQAQNIATAKRSIASALPCVSPGEAINVRGGTYPESFIGNIPAGTSWEEPVIIQGHPGERVVVKPNPGADFVFRFAGPQHYIILDNLVIDGSNVRYDAVKITITGGVAAHHIRIKDSVVENAGVANKACTSGACGSGIMVGNGSHSNEFINLNVSNNGRTDFDHGYYLSGTHSNLIDGGVIEGNYGYGGKFDCSGDCAQESDRNILRRVVIRNNNKNGYRAAWVITGAQNLVENNIFTGNGAGINLSTTGGGNLIRYNTIASNNASTYSFNKYCIRSLKSKGDEFVNNICWDHANGSIQLLSGGTLKESNNLLGVDPMFVDAAAGDFRLRPGSPAIDAGAALPVTEDFAGKPRPQGKGYDIGAHEQ